MCSPLCLRCDIADGGSGTGGGFRQSGSDVWPPSAPMDGPTSLAMPSRVEMSRAAHERSIKAHEMIPRASEASQHRHTVSLDYITKEVI